MVKLDFSQCEGAKVLRYTEFDRQKVRELLDEHAAEVAREVRITGFPDSALARNGQEIERFREIMNDEERKVFDELMDSEINADLIKAREGLIIARHEARSAQHEHKVKETQELQATEDGLKISKFAVLAVIGVLILLFLFR
jgi:hypothetical protein